MKVVPVKAFVPHIAPLLDKCPDFVIQQEVVKTIASACRDSGCLTTTVEFKTRKGQAGYELRMPEGLDAEIVRYCYCDQWQLEPVTYNMVTGRLPFDWRNSEATPKYYTFRQHGELTLLPTPDNEYPMRVDVTASIVGSTAVVPEFFLSSYLDLVTYGVLARAHRIAGQPFSNLELATMYDGEYARELSILKSESFRDFTRTAGRLRYNRILY